MKLCVPIEADKGLESKVCGHFGSAPSFVIYDFEKDVHLRLDNGNQHRVHGQCSPLTALADQQIDAMVVGGIGAGAISKLNAMGIKVYQAQAPTVREAVEAFRRGDLPEIALADGCQGHGEHGCH